MKIAVCISGSIRTFPTNIFRQGFMVLKNKIPDFDTYLILKLEDYGSKTLMNSNEAIDEFIKTIKLIKPMKIIIFKKFTNKIINTNRYLSQMSSINLSFVIANNKKYDYFLRYRPDFVLIKLNLDLDKLNKKYIYTTRKHDAKGSDQVFLISKILINEWWKKQIFTTIPNKYRKDITPEYVIFNNKSDEIKILNGPCFFGGLSRDNTRISFFDPENQIENPYKNNIELKRSNDFKIEKKYLIKLDDELNIISKKLNINYKYIKYLDIEKIFEKNIIL